MARCGGGLNDQEENAIDEVEDDNDTTETTDSSSYDDPTGSWSMTPDTPERESSEEGSSSRNRNRILGQCLNRRIRNALSFMPLEREEIQVNDTMPSAIEFEGCHASSSAQQQNQCPACITLDAMRRPTLPDMAPGLHPFCIPYCRGNPVAVPSRSDVVRRLLPALIDVAEEPDRHNDSCPLHSDNLGFTPMCSSTPLKPATPQESNDVVTDDEDNDDNSKENNN